MLLAIQIDLNNPYILIAAASLILLLSSFYNLLARRTNIPSVLLLIATGILISQALVKGGVDQLNIMPALEILGIIGVIMIVLEAALDLRISREKLPMIFRSFMVALICLLASSAAIGYALQYFLEGALMQNFLYAVPLAVMSSAIIIPSVSGLLPIKKEFMIYESTFSDILGIMLFYFIISMMESGGQEAATVFGIGFVVTVIVGFVASYGLIYLFKDATGQVRLFLLIAILLFLYSVGKLLHLSPLLIILIFGISLANHESFFRIFRNYFKEHDPVEEIEKEFHLITAETAFVVRTFFFIIFGMSIELGSLVGLNVFFLSAVVLFILYAIRFVSLRLFSKSILPELWIAPRGLVTILLFYAIPEKFVKANFDNGILLYVIIISSVIMSFALIGDKARSKPITTEEQEQ